MGQETKIKIKYRLGALPADLSGAFDNADPVDMKVLAVLLMLCDGEGVTSVSDACDALSIEPSELSASLKFWRGAGVIENLRGVSAENGKVKEKTSEIKTAHRNGVLEQSAVSSEYTSGELAEISRQPLRLFRRHGVPSLYVSVVYTFLCILVGVQDIISNVMAVFSVLALCLRNCRLRAFPIQLNDFFVFHVNTSYIITASHYNTRKLLQIGCINTFIF